MPYRRPLSGYSLGEQSTRLTTYSSEYPSFSKASNASMTLEVSKGPVPDVASSLYVTAWIKRSYASIGVHREQLKRPGTSAHIIDPTG